MLEQLTSIEWQKLTHAYGDASDVPGLIQALASDDKTTREEAIYALYGNIWHQGTVYEATSYAVPFLIELLELDAVQGKNDILELLAHLAHGYSYKEVHQDMEALIYGEETVNAPQYQAEMQVELYWVKQAHDAVARGTSTYLKLLEHAEATVRRAVPSTLACLPERADEILPSIEAHLKSEPDPQVRVRLLSCIETLTQDDPHRRGETPEQTPDGSRDNSLSDPAHLLQNMPQPPSMTAKKLQQCFAEAEQQLRQHMEAGRNQEAWEAYQRLYSLALDQYVPLSAELSTAGASLPALQASEIADLYNQRGTASYFLKQYEQAIADFDQAIRLDPDNRSWLFNRGSSYLDFQQYEQAIADFDRVLALAPDDAHAYKGRALAYARSQQHEQAIADFGRALALMPDDVTLYHDRAVAYAEKEQYEQAIADYTQAMELAPDDDALYYGRAFAYAERGQYEQAIADYTQAMELAPGDAILHQNRGLAYYKSSQYEQAIADFDWLLQQDSQNVQVYNIRGCAYHFLGEYEQAITDYDRAIQLSPQYALVYSNRGEAYQCLAQWEQAITDFEHALALDPSLPDTRQYLEQTLQQRQAEEKA